MAQVVNTQNFQDEVLNSKTPVLVDFYADWCGPCQMLSPIVEELEGEYQGKVKIVKLDVDASQDIAMQYGVMSIPTLIMFKEGAEVKRTQGALPKSTLKGELDGLLA